MINLYQPYLNRISDVLNLSNPLESTGFPTTRGRNQDEIKKSLENGMLEFTQPNTLENISILFGSGVSKLPRLGSHPDFEHLKHSHILTEEHYIVSMFIDVKGSTNMFKKLTKEQVHAIVNIVIRASTNTIALFGGHVHRIMFDGVMCYFGGKGIMPFNAVMDAVNSASMFCHFMHNELPILFEKFGLEKVYTRIGIDFGKDSDVLWGTHGTVGCGELSTTSLHTSLAAKMQKEAKSNECMTKSGHCQISLEE